MAGSACRAAKHAFVLLLRSLAIVYDLSGPPVSRDSPDTDVFALCRRVSRKAHPDKGGRPRDQQQLNGAKDTWMKLRTAGAQAGRPRGQPTPKPALDDPTSSRGTFRIRGEATMFTYQGLPGPEKWPAFVVFVKTNIRAWKVKYWTATFEDNRGSKCHAHLMVQFTSAVDRTAQAFEFEGIRPRVDSNDICGQGLCRKRLQQSIDRGHFYAWANKLGTLTDATGSLCVASNYAPSWTDEPNRYQVLGAWPEKLWKSHKLSHAVFEEYLFDCRDGVSFRKRNLDACRDKEEEAQLQNQIRERSKRIRTNTDLFKSFPHLPEATLWLDHFKADALRYPVLVVLGPSRCGKTEWVKTLFKNPLELKVGTLPYFPDGMRAFTRGTHDAVILDDIRDLTFVADHQEKLQGKYDALVEFASTPGGMCAYKKDLFAIPIVVTVNYSTGNLGYLDNHDWLGNPGNRVVITLSNAFFEA